MSPLKTLRSERSPLRRVGFCAVSKTERSTPASSVYLKGRSGPLVKRSTSRVLRHIPRFRIFQDDGQSRIQTTAAVVTPDRGRPRSGQHRNRAAGANVNISRHSPGYRTRELRGQTAARPRGPGRSNGRPTHRLKVSAKDGASHHLTSVPA